MTKMKLAGKLPANKQAYYAAVRHEVECENEFPVFESGYSACKEKWVSSTKTRKDLEK
ncbi:MAG: hypothetical protein HRU20_28170 [Pseudomonadales bacterium]|nr:hypothetical protein [Pseudomonadales bacterium]